jgi:hypothetical protein
MKKTGFYSGFSKFGLIHVSGADPGTGEEM